MGVASQRDQWQAGRGGDRRRLPEYVCATCGQTNFLMNTDCRECGAQPTGYERRTDEHAYRQAQYAQRQPAPVFQQSAAAFPPIMPHTWAQPPPVQGVWADAPSGRGSRSRTPPRTGEQGGAAQPQGRVTHKRRAEALDH